MADLTEDLKLLIRTRHAIVTIRTLDEAFATRTIQQAGRELNLPVLEWSLSEGLRRVQPPTKGGVGGTRDLAGALGFMRGNNSTNIYVLKDALCHLKDPASQRLLRETAMEYSRDSRTVFMIDADGELPAALHPLAVPFDLALPDEKETIRIIKTTLRELMQFGEATVEMDRKDLDGYVANLRGLTRMEISQVVADSVLRDGKLDTGDVSRAIELKRQRFRQTGVLDYVSSGEVKPKVGGMKSLLGWLGRRAKAFTREARKYGLEPPRGILMLGVQGCGKSLMARIVAAEWNLPLLRIDVGSLFDKYVGETERHLRQAFSVTSAMAPCVLWIDEIEKAFASAAAGAGGAASDGGLSQRMFGQLLTWMQDRKDPVFLVATANDISALPPELMRKGRFDEIFFVDLPSGAARREIFRIHLTKRNRRPEDFDVDGLVAAAEGFSGAEIEQAIVSAMYAAFARDREVATDDVVAEIRATQPISVVMAEKIAELRRWAKGRCVSAD